MRDPEPLLRAEGLRKTYSKQAGWFSRTSHSVHAVNDVSFEIMPGETLGLVGESGSGKSTTGRLVLGLERTDAGEVWFEGRDIAQLGHSQMRSVRKRMQVVFQDPYAALNPRMTVGDFVAEPMIIHRTVSRMRERQDRVSELFKMVGLDPSFKGRYPHEFSGGQRQRVSIARAIALDPRLIVADEPITALDVSIQAQIINLFLELRERLNLSFLFIAHDLSMVKYLCHRVAVMFRGCIVEIGPISSVFEDPLHPYTRALLSAVPVPNPRVERQRKREIFNQDEFHPDRSRLTEVRPQHFVLTPYGD